jgi:hypothetical protein
LPLDHFFFCFLPPVAEGAILSSCEVDGLVVKFVRDTISMSKWCGVALAAGALVARSDWTPCRAT